MLGYKEERTVHIMDEETFYLKNKKIKLLLIDRLLEGEPPVSMKPLATCLLFFFLKLETSIAIQA